MILKCGLVSFSSFDKSSGKGSSSQVVGTIFSEGAHQNIARACVPRNSKVE